MTIVYDDPVLFVKLQLTHAPTSTGLSVPGTASSDTVLLRIPIANAITVNGTARLRLTTGGTAAGPTITFGKSLAGTGAVAAFGTYAFGTAANSTTATVALTTTNLSAGDEVVVTNVAGTAASTPVILFAVPFNQQFV